MLSIRPLSDEIDGVLLIFRSVARMQRAGGEHHDSSADECFLASLNRRVVLIAKVWSAALENYNLSSGGSGGCLLLLTAHRTDKGPLDISCSQWEGNYVKRAQLHRFQIFIPFAYVSSHHDA